MWKCDSEARPSKGKRAQKWKLKPSSEGRQGVSISTEYAIAGSQRYRQLQERKKQKEKEQRNAPQSHAKLD